MPPPKPATYKEHDGWTSQVDRTLATLSVAAPPDHRPLTAPRAGTATPMRVSRYANGRV
jgi:hypothetical protein